MKWFIQESSFLKPLFIQFTGRIGSGIYLFSILEGDMFEKSYFNRLSCTTQNSNLMKFLRGFRIRFTADSLKAYGLLRNRKMKEHRKGIMELVEKDVKAPSQGQSQQPYGQHIQGSETVL